MKFVFRRRRSFRRMHRSALRGTSRVALRQRWRSPDDLAEALTCFRRAIRAHRRLNRLAPHEFDAAVVDRDRQEGEERRAWMATWEPALEKAYGPSTPAEREARLQEELRNAQPPPLSKRTQRLVEQELANWHLWMNAGKLARARHQQRHPHASVSLGRTVRLLEVALDFGSLATGRDWRRPAPPSAPAAPEPDWEADLRRAYGSQSNLKSEVDPGAVPHTWPTSVTGLKTAEPASSAVVATEGQPPVTTNATPEHSVQDSKSVRPSHQRRDAWQAWARQQRRSAG